jgi:integrase
MEIVPGRVPEFLTADGVGLFRAEDRVFEAMLDGWRAQMLARGLTVDSIKGMTRNVAAFQSYTNDYPWTWAAHDLDDYFAHRRSQARPLAVRTLRTYAHAIRAFCSYTCDPRYGWVALCEQLFGDVPSQIVFDWNSPRHSVDDGIEPSRRAFTRRELQTLFDAVDDMVDLEHARGSKRWLPALRDSIAFKVAYAYGLRRRELVKLEVGDFGPNPHVPAYGRFGAVQVRWAKGTSGSGPRRRTVLTVPEFEWVVELLAFWTAEGRSGFATADRGTSLWPSERAGAAEMRTLDRSLARARELAGLPAGLTLHSLRHSYVTHLIEAGYDPLFVQQQVGHRHGSTTALYTSVSSDYKHKVIQRMLAERLRLGKEDEDG